MSAPVERARTSSGVVRGFFLTLEGVEGGGKSTHAKRLEGGLAELGFRVSRTREPGGTPLGEALRELLLGVEGDPPVAEAELFMMLAGRAQHLRRFILPRLDRGGIVICDRFSDASLAYQGAGRGIGLDRVAAINDLAVGGIQPDLTFLIDVPIEEAMRRVKRRLKRAGALDRFDQETQDFHLRVQSAYHELAARDPARFRIINAVGERDDVNRIMMEELGPRLAGLRAEGALA
jgi:dTMP kinase